MSVVEQRADLVVAVTPVRLKEVQDWRNWREGGAEVGRREE